MSFAILVGSSARYVSSVTVEMPEWASVPDVAEFPDAPVTAVSVALVAVVTAGLLFYFKTRNRQL